LNVINAYEETGVLLARRPWARRPELRVGLIPGAGATQRLTRLMGVSRAIEWVLRARTVKPEVATELNLVQEVVDDAATRAMELAEEIATFPPMAVGNAKIALYLGPTPISRRVSRSRTCSGLKSCSPTTPGSEAQDIYRCAPGRAPRLIRVRQLQALPALLRPLRKHGG